MQQEIVRTKGGKRRDVVQSADPGEAEDDWKDEHDELALVKVMRDPGREHEVHLGDRNT